MKQQKKEENDVAVAAVMLLQLSIVSNSMMAFTAPSHDTRMA